MSGRPAAALRSRFDGAGRVASDRAFALVGAAVLTGAYLYALYDVIDVVGGPGGLELFVAVVLGTLALAVALARTLPLRGAVGLGALLLVAGLVGYLYAIPEGTFEVSRQLRDTIALLTGLSVLRMTRAAVWAIGFTPGPLFVSTYLFLRRRYGFGGLVGGATLAFFISTGDVGVLHGLVGALGAVAALGFGRLDREGGAPGQRDAVGVLLVAILVVTTSLSLVPGGAAQPLLPDGRGGTIDASLVSGGDSVTVQGRIELSPEVRFVVEADRPARWRVGAFDRYTGGGWIRSGQSQPYEGSLTPPQGGRPAPLRQTVRVRTESGVMPAAWKPIRVTQGSDGTSVTSMGSLEPRGTLEPGDEYTVVSFESRSSTGDLRTAGTDYPDGLLDRYTQLPESTPDRVGAFTSQLTAEAETTYDTARVIEQWLEANKAYSLDVERPRGDVAASFIFEMDRGYCTYYATAMVAMLRSQDIPARFVVGYTSGDPTAEDQWTVRGLDSHAWVEVYFPGHGWVAFDPTPAAPRESAEQDQLDRARAEGVPGVGAEASTPQALTPGRGDVLLTTAPEDSTDDPAGDGGTPTVPPGLIGAGEGSGAAGDGDGLGSGLPDEEAMLYGLILLVGAATAAHRTGLFVRARRLVWVRRRPDGPPARRVEATFERLDYLLGRQYRPRRRGESPRAYLRALRGRAWARSATGGGDPTGPHDRRLDRLFDLYEQAHYAGHANSADDDRAWRVFCELREEWSLRR